MERGFHSSTMAEVEISDDMEKGYLTGKLSDQDTTKIKEDLTKKLDEGEERWNKNSIYMVPKPMVAVNREAFTPKMVSMGPYHHGKVHLMPMEVHKHRAARCFIEKSKKHIEDYIKALLKVLPDLMDSYRQLNKSWMQKVKGSFLELMLIDGCFLLEILHVHKGEFEGYEEHDPIFSKQGTMSFPHIAFDLMMLENQVPFTAIETILTVKTGKKSEEICKEINDLVSFFILGKPLQEKDERRGLHMLDIIRNLFVEEKVGKHNGEVIEGSSSETTAKPRSVTELCDAGIKFEAADNDVISLSSIKMENDVLTIPIIYLSLKSEVIGCNMIAFELMHHEKGTAACSYFTFMNGLMASAADVKRLRSLQIIQSTQLSDDTIFETFKRFAKGNMAVGKSSNLYHIQHELDVFYEKRMAEWRRRIGEWITFFKNTYLKNPWTFISVVAATILLALAVAQTYYVAQSYWDDKHKNK